jgi:CIC family chloride channel protein
MFFAIEVIVGYYTFATMAPIAIASVVGTAISRAHFGNYPAFEPPGLVITSLWELPAFALLGALAGGVAYLFVRAPFWAHRLWQTTPVPAWLRPAAAGLLVGIVAVWLPKVMGVGYEGTNAAVANQLSLSMLVLLTIAKLALTGICLGSGFAGGVFSPSLFVGATLGAAFGVVAASIFPELASSPGLYALAGMGAVAAAVIGSPMSTVLMVFELTANFEAAIAVMIAVIVSSVLFWEIGGRSFFKSVLLTQGIDLDRLDADRAIAKTGSVVADVMRTDMATVSADCRLAEVQVALLKASYGVVFVIDKHQHLLGTITNANLPLTRLPMELKNFAAWELMTRASTSVSQHACVAETLKEMEQNRVCHLPVIDDDQGNRLIGFVHERDVIDLYFNALLDLPYRQRGRVTAARGGVDTVA